MADDQQVHADLRLIVGGNFTLDALGPQRHQDVLRRVAAQPEAYLRAFESLFLGSRVSAQEHSKLHLSMFLKLVSNQAPDRVRSLASRLATQYDTAMGVRDDAQDAGSAPEARPEGSSTMAKRLDARRRELRRMAGA